MVQRPAGIVATDVRISPGLLAATEFGGSQAMAAAVGRLEVQFPSLVRPLTLRVSRLRLAVQQVQLPQVGAAGWGGPGSSRPALLVRWSWEPSPATG